MDPETHGVIIGRFMPPHAGHQYLVDFGRNLCDRLTVLVCTLSSEPIPGELRYRWMQELFPDVHMVHITEEIPEASKDSPTAIPIWAETVRAYLSATPTYVFASEDYGAPLAAELGARFVPVDPARRQFPVSATMIRENPLANWDYIPEPVRPYFLRRVSVVESRGGRTAIAPGRPGAPAPSGPGGPGGEGSAGGVGSGEAPGRDPGPSMAQRLAAHYKPSTFPTTAAFGKIPSARSVRRIYRSCSGPSWRWRTPSPGALPGCCSASRTHCKSQSDAVSRPESRATTT